MNWRWILIMAWRDSRHSRHRLLLYVFSVVLGVAALVSIRSFGNNLLSAVESQAKILLGADLSLSSRTAFTPDQIDFLNTLEGDQSQQTSFSSMAYFPRGGQTRLVYVRAVSGQFPYYGALETAPASAAITYKKGPYALVDRTLMLQFGCEIGDELRLGSFTFQIAGSILGIPGESAAFSEFAPRVFIPLRYLEETELIQVGSRVRYTAFCKLPAGTDPEAFVEANRDLLRKLDLSSDTVQERQEDLGRELENLNRFLGLVGFIALVLGGIGVASSIHLFIRQRITTVAILRCIGASPQLSLAIYLTQAGFIGLLGALIGSSLGLAVQQMIPWVLQDLIPVEVDLSISWGAVAQGLLIGSGTAFLFALIPLVSIRNISPLLALRSSYERDSEPRQRDRLLLLLYALLLGALLIFSILNSEHWYIGLGFFLGMVVVFGLLVAVAHALMRLTRRYFPAGWSYTWRQGLANLYRPQNQTIVLMLAVGLGTFFLVTLYLTQVSLLQKVTALGGEKRPNLVFFDIQSDQREELAALVSSQKAPILQDVPIVTMRVKSIDGRSVKEIIEDQGRRAERWALTREYRSTYRTSLSDTEVLLEGTFQPEADSGPIQVSLESRIAEELGVSLNSKVVFDIQGVPIETVVGSIREVDWQRFQPNFFIVFPAGVLEDAPQFHVLVTRTENPSDSAELQRKVVEKFPNISAVDLSLVLETIDSVLQKVLFVIRFMALFSMLTGLVVVTGAIVSGKYQRTRECVLLRTLGASRSQILRILLIEYFFLGVLSALTGLTLAVLASWGITYFVFDSTFFPSLPALAVSFVIIVTLTITMGMVNSLGVFNHPPLAVLRDAE